MVQDVVSTSLDDVLLDCAIEVDPRLDKDNLTKTTYSWSKDSLVIPASNSPSLLLQKVLKPQSQGLYGCTASNLLENATRTVRLVVLGEEPEFIATEDRARSVNSKHFFQ